MGINSKSEKEPGLKRTGSGSDPSPVKATKRKSSSSSGWHRHWLLTPYMSLVSSAPVCGVASLCCLPRFGVPKMAGS